ncbi:hypothetical protein T484DRAFT_1809848 [Baffinella frigidus]|nr:hypothetical protein T484DRAFT_1809848 [Cryptophyta sp. CCMP2293]
MPRLLAALPPLLLLLLAQPVRASCPALYNKTGHAVFNAAEYLSRCDFVNNLGRGNFTLELWVKVPAGFDPKKSITFFSYATGVAPKHVHDALLVWNRGYNGNSEKYALALKVHASPVSTSDSPVWDLTDGKSGSGSSSDDDGKQGRKCCTVSFYKDGEHIETKEIPTCKFVASGGCVVLGQKQKQMCDQFHKKSEFQGFMTEVRLWNSSRTESEIAGHMLQRIGITEAQSTPSLVALWPLDCVYTFRELVAEQNLATCLDPSGTPPEQQPGKCNFLALAAIGMNEGATCPGFDECCEETHNCDINATCTNTVDSFTCECDPGYEGDGIAPPAFF